MRSMFACGLDDLASGVKWSALQAALLTVGEREPGFHRDLEAIAGKPS